LRIEHSRKHGPFDGRYPPIRHEPAPASLRRPGEERLDWQGFLARFFPASSRHASDPLAAYESYMNDVDGRPADGSAAAGRRSSAVRGARSEMGQRGEDEQEPPATADTDRWEGEGGAPAGHPRRTRRHERPVGAQRD
jgi:hypothetical protein